LLKKRAAQARRLGKPRAAYEAAEWIWQAAQTGTRRLETARRKSLLDLLTSNQIFPREDEPLTED
jgi:hypothetical protein